MPFTRIAPTPSGYLHRGNAYNFLLTQHLARQAGGDILLRIDDIDRARFRPEYLQDIFDSLEWLGISFEEGPASLEEFELRWSQQQRQDRYQALLDELRRLGFLYPCSYSRKEIQKLSSDGIYRGEQRNEQLSLDDPGVAWRILVPDGKHMQWKTEHDTFNIDLHQSMGHFVVRKKDGQAAYQIASLSDDIDFAIQLIVRGEDLIPSTAAQLYLADCLGFMDFRRSVTFHHHPLILDADGEKLAKSQGAESLQAMRQAGLPPPWFDF